MDRLLQLLERGLLKRIGRRRPDERAQVVVNCAEDVFTKRRDAAPFCRVTGRNKHGHFFRIVPEVPNVKVVLFARYHRLELGDVVVKPEVEVID